MSEIKNDDNSPCSNPAFTPEGIAAAHAETERLCRELDITNADHIAVWIERNTIPDEPMSQCASWLACRIIEAHEAAVTELTASLNRASDACASVQKERDDLRETLGESVGLIERAQSNTAAHYRNWHSAARTVIAELMASKDGEINKWRSYLDTEIERHRKTVAELSVLRAGTMSYRDVNQELQDELENVQSELAALRAENERLRNFCTLEQCEEAAERNTAEPSIDIAPVVEVTEADHAFAEAWEINHAPGSAHRIELSKRAAIYRTEAEARGRRQALEVAIEYLTNNKIPRAWELKRLMTEVKA